MDTRSTATYDEVLRLRKALEQAVSVIKAWHGGDAFDIYFNHSPEMKPIRVLDFCNRARAALEAAA